MERGTAEAIINRTVTFNSTMMTSSIATPELDFQPSLEKLAAIAHPTDFIVSGFLRASRTFKVYEAVFKALGVEGTYLPCEIPRISETLGNSSHFNEVMDVVRQNKNIRSLVISDPYKILAYENIKARAADRLTQSAIDCGAVNLIIRENERLVGSNIDGRAFQMGLAEVFPDARPKDIAIIGCGGVGSAVAIALAPNARSMVIVDTQREQISNVADKISKANPLVKVSSVIRPRGADLTECDLVYNSSGVGKASAIEGSEFLSPLNLEIDILPANAWIAVDANYTPTKTQFLIETEKRGAQIVNGAGHMLAFVTQHVGQLIQSELTLASIREIVTRAGVLK